MPVIFIGQSIDHRIECVVYLATGKKVKGFHMQLIADALFVGAGRGDQEEQRLFTGVTGTFGQNIVELAVGLGMDLIQHKPGHVQAMLRTDFRRQHLIESGIAVVHDTLPQRVRRASVPYDVWHQQGYLVATEGNVIHYGFIEEFIKELGEKYHIREIAFDRWGAVQMTQNLEGMGFTVVPFGQGFKDMSPPTKEFYKLLMEGRIVHGGNPIMAWMAGNVVVDTDPAGNIKPTKAKSPEKIDGIVAAIMALDRCIRNEGQQQGSIYDERDMIVF